MKQLVAYKVELKNHKNTLLLQYNIKDRFHSKRYYFLSIDEPAIYRIKHIDNFLEYCELNNINIVKLDLSEKLRNDILTLIGVLVTKKSINNQEIKYDKHFYDSLATAFNDYDYKLYRNVVKENENLNVYKKNSGGKH